MKTTSLASLFLAAAALLCSAPLFAQLRAETVEISPFYGRLFGGEFARGSNSLFNEKVDVDDANTYGVRVGYNATDNFEFEVQASRTDTHFISHDSGEVFGGSGERLGDLRIDYLLGYGTFNFGHRRAVPYVSLGAGVAHLQPSATPTPAHDSTRFTASLAAGVKVFLNPHIALQGGLRGYATYLNSSDTCHHDNCNDAHYLDNGEISGGLTFAF
jgi:hypothetical protein